MNLITFLIYITLYFSFLIGLIVFTFRWMKLNNLVLSIDSYEDGLLLNKKVRGRFGKNGFFYKFTQLDFKFNKLKCHYPEIIKENFQDNILTTEGIRFISPNKILNIVKLDEYDYKAWTPPNDVSKIKKINNIRIVKLRKLRKELWESTDNTTRAEQIYRLILPVAATILAMCCLIFFPRIYDHIMSYSNNALASAASSWADQLKNFMRPMG